MKKQIYGLIKYNYEINKKRNILFKYYDFYPNRLNQKEMAHIIGALSKYSLDEINSFFKQFFEVKSMSKRISDLVYDIKRELYFENKYEIIKTLKEKIYTINELPKEKLLSKAGKELKGVALLMRLRKIAEEMKVSIEHNSEIIKGV